MRFQTKMVVMYAIFMLGVAFVLGVIYHEYSLRQYVKIEEKNLEITAEQLITQFDEILKPMELATNYILSDPSILSGIRMLSKTEEGYSDNPYIIDEKTNIRKRINTDYLTNNFYRTIIFNQSGSVISNSNYLAKKVRSFVDFINMPWIGEADQSKGIPILVNAHEDTWGLEHNPQVFSLLKALQGENMGYIEIQKKVESLEDELQVPKDGLEYMIFLNGTQLLYSSLNTEHMDEYMKIVQEEGSFVKIFNVNVIDKQQVIAKKESKSYAFSILVIENTDNLVNESAYLTPMTFLVAFIFFAISMVFVMLLSIYLTKPIRQLRTVMENTKLENIGNEIMMDNPNNEIEALNFSYQKVLGRLKESMVKEKRMSFLHLQAQFDSLQSQVNPHFLYNVLNIISARGMSNEDEKICEMCGSLANMLRYSTNTKIRYARIEEELEYLDQYFYLLKARYEHKIEFKVDVDECIRMQIIPKIILQQIVENSINHGFENSTNQMQVTITGWKEEDRWYIKVHDNGQGFDDKALADLMKNLEKTKRRLLKERDNMELEIGGMGLINTYARLLLLYNDELTFEFKNVKDGVDIIIGANIRRKLSE
ncbi:MAG: sensor histidine kinase [Lachnotalea sp.]